MKKLLNTLYVTTEGASLRKDGENLVAEVEVPSGRACRFTCSAPSWCSARSIFRRR